MIAYFKRNEFQQRGSPRAHILLWFDKDPKEVVGEDMPGTIQRIDALISVDPEKLQCVKNQMHKHTFTCYKRAKDENKKCRFGAPFWPMRETAVLIPMPKEDSRRDMLRRKFADMHRSLEFEECDDLDLFLARHNVRSYGNYLNVLRAGITRPRVFVKRTMQQKWMNNFNPWIASLTVQHGYTIRTGTILVRDVRGRVREQDQQGISSLHCDLMKLRDEYPDKDYTGLMKELGIRMLNAVEMSSQETASYLLNLHMSESSRKVQFIPTFWPHERRKVRKTHKQMEEEELAED